MDRRPDRTIDQHSVRESHDSSERSNHERPKEDRRSSSSSIVPKLQDRRDFPKPQERDEPKSERRDAPKLQDRRDSPRLQEIRDAHKPQDRRDASLNYRRDSPRVQDRGDVFKTDRRDTPKPHDRRDSPKIQERRDARKSQDRDASKPLDRRNTPEQRDRRDAPRFHDRSGAPESEDRRYAPARQEKRDVPVPRNRRDSPKLQERRDAPKPQDRKDARRDDDRRSRERPREVSVQTSPDKSRRRERDRVDSRSRSPKRPELLIDEIRKNTRDHARISSDAVSHRHSRDESAHNERPVMAKVSKIEESEQEDKGFAKRPVAKSTSEGTLEKAETVWMSNERVKIIEGFAKEAIKQYKRDITVEEYKNVMRAVVRDCYKKRILDGVKIKDKVDESVRAVKNGEQLDIGHHSSKRPETSGGSSAVPAKRQKISV
ncbi:unnamed protein product [Cylicostephanus goldi]|uniref:Set2 Rpb1 interacting domain-containing protein n=1 Tax=Cylicostephanus goldi TaxID=71465 RepID=A0A3P7Q7N7_CYLGO|nr:unnamed protein product [Cylicostephanus goldi]